jgi:hypothetical protein
MDMTLTQDSSASPTSTVVGRWTIRERDPKTGLVVAEKTVKNILTNFGLTALASAIGGAYSPPQYLVVEGLYGTIQYMVPIGSTSVTFDVAVDTPGDTQLVLSLGLPAQETVTFNAVSGTGPYTYTLTTPTTQVHNAGEYACRAVAVTDTMATSVQNEQQYDPVNAPNQRAVSPGGYSSGSGNFTIQFYLSGSIPLQNFVVCGLSDSPTVGQGNLHNHFVLGFFRAGDTNDIEIDGSITIANG